MTIGGLLFGQLQSWIKTSVEKNVLTGFHTVDGKKYYYDETSNPVINDKKVIGDTNTHCPTLASPIDVTSRLNSRTQKRLAEAKAEQAQWGS